MLAALVVPDSCWLQRAQPARPPSPWDFPGRGVLPRAPPGIFPTQGRNPGLLPCRETLPSEPPGKSGSEDQADSTDFWPSRRLWLTGAVFPLFLWGQWGSRCDLPQSTVSEKPRICSDSDLIPRLLYRVRLSTVVPTPHTGQLWSEMEC